MRCSYVTYEFNSRASLLFFVTLHSCDRFDRGCLSYSWHCFPSCLKLRLFSFPCWNYRMWTESSITLRTATEPRSGCANLLSAGAERATKLLRVSVTTPSTSTHPSLLTSSVRCSSRDFLDGRHPPSGCVNIHHQQWFLIPLHPSHPAPVSFSVTPLSYDTIFRLHDINVYSTLVSIQNVKFYVFHRFVFCTFELSFIWLSLFCFFLWLTVLLVVKVKL